jgi:slime mold repeat-containing protein
VKLDTDASRFLFSSYLGGSLGGVSPSTGEDVASAIALDPAGNMYVSGYTLSFDFPVTRDALRPHLTGDVCDPFGGTCGDGFLAKLSAGGPGVTPAVHLAVDPAEVAPGGTIVATWAGNPTPSASDYLRLYALGSAGDDFDDAVIYWPTPDAAAGTLALELPADLPVGWYELRLLSPAPDSGLPVPIARTRPIRVAGTVAPPPPTCDADCDDGDPCTDDACVVGTGCVSTPVTGFASVTCTCRRSLPSACADQPVPGSMEDACSSFDDAATATDRVQALRRLKRGAKALKGSLAAVGRRRKLVSRDCATALRVELRDANARAARLAKTLRRSAR